jgi:hypothetical protein
MEAVRAFETVCTNSATWRYNPEDRNQRVDRRERPSLMFAAPVAGCTLVVVTCFVFLLPNPSFPNCCLRVDCTLSCFCSAAQPVRTLSGRHNIYRFLCNRKVNYPVARARHRSVF